MPENKKNSHLAIVIICVTIILLAGIGGAVYIQNKQIEQKNRELQQSKELKEKEIKSQQEAAEKAAQINATATSQAATKEARATCIASGKSYDYCTKAFW